MARRAQKTAEEPAIPDFLRRPPLTTAQRVALDERTHAYLSERVAPVLHRGAVGSNTFLKPKGMPLEEWEAHLAAERLEREAAREARRAARPPRVDVLAGLTPLKEVLAGLTTQVSAAAARRIVEEAKLVHTRFHFRPEEVERVREVLSRAPVAKIAKGARLPITKATRYQWKAGAANPSRPGTGFHANVEHVRLGSGKTVAELQAAGGRVWCLSWCVKQNLVTLINAEETKK